MDNAGNAVFPAMSKERYEAEGGLLYCVNITQVLARSGYIWDKWGWVDHGRHGRISTKV